LVISVKDLSYSYPKEYLVFENLSVEVKEGEFWGILGRNGAGKTTFIDLLLGINYSAQGRISILGEGPCEKRDKHPREIAFLSQDVRLNGKIKVQDFFHFHSFFYKNYSKEIEKELAEYFKLNTQSLIGALSSGQQKKVQVVAGLASNTKIILIDEITAVLDPEMRYRFFSKLVEFNKQKNKTIMLATNIAEDLIGRVDKILYINDYQGQVISPDEINRIFKTQ